MFVSMFLTIMLYVISAQTDHVKAQLISEVTSIQPGHPFWVAVRLQIKEHWHTYWRNPGDSGLPTQVQWELPKGFVASEIHWPYPKRFEMPPLVNLGYEGKVLLLTRINPPESVQAGSKVKLGAKVDWLVCKDVCLPGHADLIIELPMKNEKPKVDSRWVDDFSDTRKNLPQSSKEWDINAISKEKQIILSIKPPSWLKHKLTNIMFFPEQPGVVDYSAQQNIIQNQESYTIEIKPSPFSIRLPTHLKGVLLIEEVKNRTATKHKLKIDVPLEFITK